MPQLSFPTLLPPTSNVELKDGSSTANAHTLMCIDRDYPVERYRFRCPSNHTFWDRTNGSLNQVVKIFIHICCTYALYLASTNTTYSEINGTPLMNISLEFRPRCRSEISNEVPRIPSLGLIIIGDITHQSCTGANLRFRLHLLCGLASAYSKAESQLGLPLSWPHWFSLGRDGC